MSTLEFKKGQLVMLAKNNEFIGFVVFSHYEKKTQKRQILVRY